MEKHDLEYKINKTSNESFGVRAETRFKNSKLIGAREFSGLTQIEAAEKIGISPMKLSGYELMRTYPSQGIQDKICNFYESLGIYLSREQVFPPGLANLMPRKRYIDEIEIPQEMLISLSEVDKRLLPTAYAPDKLLEIKERTTEIGRALDILKQREAEVVNLYFGLEFGKTYTLEEIGNMFSLTQERVRQIKEKAIRKLRHSKYSKILRDYLGIAD